MSKINVIGIAGNPEMLFYRNLPQTTRNKQFVITELHESEYDQRVKLLKRNQTLRQQFKSLKPLDLPSLDDSLIERTNKRPILLIKNGSPQVQPHRTMKFSQSMLTETYQKEIQFFRSEKSVYAYMELQVDDECFKLVIELYNTLTPKACENFIQFCQNVTIKGVDYSYKNTHFNRYLKNGYIQGGSFPHKQSIFGDYFEDESYAIKHNTEGVLGMANEGFPHSNSSQFYITLAAMPWFDRKRVAFGRVVKGMKKLQKALKFTTNPIIKIINCGTYDHADTIHQKMEQQRDEFATTMPDKAITFNKYIEQEETKHSTAQGEFTQLLKFLVNQIQKISRYAYHPNANARACAQIEESLSNNVGCQLLYLLDKNKLINGQSGKYLVVFRALEDTDQCKASAFLIFKKQTTQFKQAGLSDFKQSGENIVGVGYCVHARTSQLVIGTGYNLAIFTLLDEFRFTQQEITIPKEEQFYCYDMKLPVVREITSQLQKCQQRYTTSVFTTLHRVLRQGGLAMYNQVTIFESMIAAFIVQRAWGMSFSDGTTTLNQMKVKELDQLTMLCFGQQKWMQKIENSYLSII